MACWIHVELSSGVQVPFSLILKLHFSDGLASRHHFFKIKAMIYFMPI
jgi:hypothetical protein